ncbi:hypothetical protein ACFW9D_06175 [Streptomyces sp. NPDC059524]|uniref:hypothetical protein n=1 Tax=Streptomyces sp. NPDC059524 TaxID=3346856 RepID=UPI0036AB5C4A
MRSPKNRWPKLDEVSGIEDATPLILEWLGEQGVDALLRVDAARMREGLPPWTFAASGGPLPHGLRADGATAGECLGRALLVLRDAGVTVPF